MPQTALVREDGTERTVPITAVKAGKSFSCVPARRFRLTAWWSAAALQ